MLRKRYNRVKIPVRYERSGKLNFEIVEGNRFHYIGRHLIDVKLFLEEMEYNDFEYFINNLEKKMPGYG